MTLCKYLIEKLTLLFARPHPNIVQLLGYSIHPDNLNMILIMEFCNGGSLDIHLFDSNRDLPVPQKLELVKGIALGLNHLHANGIVHRDIAARNILLSNGVPKLSDFGMSRQLDGGKKRGTTKADTGPVRWMAPESLKDQEYSTQSDVWMFGVLMFEVFAQSEPHADEDPLDVGIKIRNEGYTPQMTANIPAEVADIMKRCWNIDPEQRPSMAEVVSLIKNLEQ
jgi:serine/threonine protein kinase